MKRLAALAAALILVTCAAAPARAASTVTHPPPVEKNAVVVGSYGGYWGLNDWYEGVLSKYFNHEQMLRIDRQIQDLTGIASKAYNYMGEGGSGYVLNDSTGDYSYSGTRVGKHYDSLVNKAFFVDVDTATVFYTMASYSFSSGGWYGYSPYIGKDVTIDGQSYRVLDARNWSPLVLDLRGDGIIDTNRHEWRPHAPAFFRERTAWFDLTGDGIPDYCEWLGKTDGLLCIPDADGTIHGALDLFGTAGGYRDGYEKLARLDTDHNGWIEGAELQNLKVWVDANGDGKAQPDELRPVSDYGVERICVTHQNFVSCYVRNGKTYKTWDWWPSGLELSQILGRTP